MQPGVDYAWQFIVMFWLFMTFIPVVGCVLMIARHLSSLQEEIWAQKAQPWLYRNANKWPQSDQESE